MVTTSVTRLRLRSRRYLLPFLWFTLMSQIQARQSKGMVGMLLRGDGRIFWTLTRWQSRADTRAFMMSGPHRSAMGRLRHWCDEASIAHWDGDPAMPLSWAEAEHRLGTEGRLSAVDHPSPAHAGGSTLGSPK